MEKRYQVFVSSTYLDLKEERREVIQALLELDCLPAGMEMFPAANEDQWTLIKEVIDASDYYVVILGGKYGSQTKEGLSYTEKEFDYAESTGMQVLGFIPTDPAALPQSKIELDPDIRGKLEAFQDKVKKRHIKSYSNPESLGAVVSRALSIAIKKYPTEGWVRGRYALTPELETEIAELREQIAEAEVSRLVSGQRAGDNAETDSFKQGADTVSVAYQVVSSLRHGSGGPVRCDVTLTWDDILCQIGPKMVDEATESEVKTRLEAHLLFRASKTGAQTAAIAEVQKPKAFIFLDTWERIVTQLRAAGLIEKGIKKRQIRDTATYYALTGKGDRHLVTLLAERRDVNEMLGARTEGA